MIWATRRGCHVDRAACAWLIRRFVDSAPEFVFVDDPDELPAGATAFDCAAPSSLTTTATAASKPS